MLVGLVACAGCRKQDDARARAEAERIWRERCTECHGATGRGDGPRRASLRTRPRDFGDRGWQRREEDHELAEVIVGGGVAEGHSAEMPPNPDLAARPEVVAELVRIVRAFGR